LEKEALSTGKPASKRAALEREAAARN